MLIASALDKMDVPHEFPSHEDSKNMCIVLLNNLRDFEHRTKNHIILLKSDKKITQKLS